MTAMASDLRKWTGTATSDILLPGADALGDRMEALVRMSEMLGLDFKRV
jgi:hypothetical protein